jgi:hypothetical protein
VAMAASCHAAQDQAISENVGSKRNEFYEWSDSVIDDGPLPQNLVEKKCLKEHSVFEARRWNMRKLLFWTWREVWLSPISRWFGCPGRDISKEIEFSASHFDETSSSLTLMAICLIDLILSYDGLKIKSENLIGDFVMSKFEKKSDMFELLIVFISSLFQFLESGCFVPWSRNQLTGWHFQSQPVCRIELWFRCHQTIRMVELNHVDDMRNHLFRRVQIDLKRLCLILLNDAVEMLVIKYCYDSDKSRVARSLVETSRKFTS